MRIPRLLAIALTVACFCRGATPAHGGGFQKPTEEVHPSTVEVKFEPTRLPLSSKAARTWISLRETKITPPKNPMPFKDVIRFVKESTKSKDGKGESLKIYVDALTLKMEEITAETQIAPPILGDGEISVQTFLNLVLKSIGLTHSVHDDLIVVDSPCDDCPERLEYSAESAWTWLLLHEEIPLHYQNETPLREVIKTIQQATVGKRPGGRGVLIHFNPIGLKEAEKSEESGVTFDIDRVPLRTSLGMLLKPLGLIFEVGDDGIVNISSLEGNNMIDDAEIFERYQLLNYAYFYSLQNEIKHREPAKLSK